MIFAEKNTHTTQSRVSFFKKELETWKYKNKNEETKNDSQIFYVMLPRVIVCITVYMCVIYERAYSIH